MSTAPIYERIVLAVDANGERVAALPIAAALGAAIGTWELLTVSAGEVEPVRLRLERLADCDDRLTPTCTVLRSNNIAAAIAHHVTCPPSALLVMGSTGRRPLTRPSDRHLARNVLARTDQPTLVVGPNADPLFRPHPGALVVCVDTPDPYPPTIEAVDRWGRTFSSDPPWVVEVVATTVDSASRGDRDVHHWATALEGLQVGAATHVLHGGDPVEWLDECAASMPNPVYVTTSRRYSERRRHLHSVTGDLIRRSHHPVLVVPDRRRSWGGATEPAK